jgi:hypothetical protein
MDFAVLIPRPCSLLTYGVRYERTVAEGINNAGVIFGFYQAGMTRPPTEAASSLWG